MKTRIILLLTPLLLLSACSPDVGEAIPTNYKRPTLADIDYIGESQDPAKARLVNMGPEHNVTTNEGIALGRVLFYDQKLSLNNTISCATCHQQKQAFADNLSLSLGFEGNRTHRNSMSLSNLWEEGQYFWDGRKSTLEEVVMGPVKDHVEMGFDRMDFLTTKLAHFDYYPPLFEKAFGSPEITEAKIAKALAQFLRALGSNGSRAELASIQGDAILTEKERAGKAVFLSTGRCGSCHLLPGFSWSGGITNDIFPVFSLFENTGLDETVTDPGAGDGRFKSPSLRNVALTAPYMHDGRFRTLEEVVEFYNSGVKANPFLGWALHAGNGGGIFPGVPGPVSSEIVPVRLNLSAYEKEALVAFLVSFTDEAYIKDEALSDPFR